MTCISYLNQWLKLCANVCVVTYTVKVAVVRGEAVVFTSGEVPDGNFTITGHDTGTHTALTVLRRTPDGRFAQEAAHIKVKEAS